MSWTPPEHRPPGPDGWSSATSAAPPPPYGSPYAWAPPRPGVVPLRPLGVGEILDGAFATLRRYPRPTLGLAALLLLVIESVRIGVDYVALNGIQVSASSDSLSDAQVADALARAGVSLVINLTLSGLAGLVLTGMVTLVVADAVLGRPMTAGRAWRALRARFGPLLGASALTWAILVGLMLLGVLPGALLVAAGSSALGAGVLVLGLLAASVPATYLTIALALAPAAVVLEGQSVRGALRRSRALVRGSWWRVCGVLMLAGVIAYAVTFIVTIPFAIAAGGGSLLGGDSAGPSFGALLIEGVGALVAATVAWPFAAGVAALLYVDRRMRAEALDVTLVAAAAAPPPA